MAIIEEVIDSVPKTEASEDDDVSATTKKKNENPKTNDENEEGEWTKLMGDDLVLKRLRAKKSDETFADIGDAVVVEYSGRALSRTDDEDGDLTSAVPDGDFFTISENVLITLGDGDLVPALEMAARFLPVDGDDDDGGGIVRSRSRFAYGLGGYDRGDEGFAVLPPKRPVEFRVRVVSVAAADSDVFRSAAHALERAAARKALGNEVYRLEGASARPRAKRLYGAAVRGATELLRRDDVDDALRARARRVAADCLNNTSLVHYEAAEYGKAKEAAATVIRDFDPNDAKALRRAARASLRDPAGTFDEARAAIDAAAEVTEGGENSKEIKSLRAEWRRDLRAYKERARRMCERMMERSLKQSEEEEVTMPMVDPADMDAEDVLSSEFRVLRQILSGVVQLMACVVAYMLYHDYYLKGRSLFDDDVGKPRRTEF